MKKAIIAAAVIALVLLALPLLLGMRTESMIRRNIESMNESPILAFEIESYERRWFSSTVRVPVGLDDDYLQSLTPGNDLGVDPFGTAFIADLALDVVVEIDHGPVAFDDGLFVGLSRVRAQLDEDSAVITEARSQLAMPYLIRMNGEVGFTGAFDFVVDVPPIDYAYEAGEIMFSGATAEGSYRGGRLALDGDIESLSVASPEGSASMLGMHMTGEYAFVSDYLSVGEGEFLIDSILANDPFGSPEPIFAAEALRIAFEGEVEDTETLYSASVIYGAESIRTGEGQFDLADAEFGIQIENLHVETFDRYYDTLLTVGVSDPELMMTSLQALADEALAHEPSLALDPFRFRLFDEPFDASISVRPSPATVQNGLDFEDPMLLASAFEATATATASKVLTDRLMTEGLKLQFAGGMPDGQAPGQDIESMARDQAQFMLAMSLGQGLIVEDGDNYTTTIEYAGGQLTINGNPLPAGMF